MLIEVKWFPTTAEAVAAFDRKQYHVLQPPSVPQVGQGFEIIAAVLRFKPKTHDTYYLQDKRAWALAKPALIELALHCGMQLSQPTLSRDEDGSPMASVSGKVMVGPGTWRELAGTYSVAKESRQHHNQAAVDGAFNAQDRLGAIRRRDKEARMLDVYGVQMAETGAMLRCIRAHLGIEHSYSAKTLRLPFVVMRVAFNMDQIGIAPTAEPAPAVLAQLDEPEAEPARRPNPHLNALTNCRIAVLNAGRAKFAVDDAELVILAGQTMKRSFWQLSLQDLGDLMAKWSPSAPARLAPDPFAETRGIFPTEQSFAQAEHPLCITAYCERPPAHLVRWSTGPFRAYCDECCTRSVDNGCIVPDRETILHVAEINQEQAASIQTDAIPEEDAEAAAWIAAFA